MSTEDVGTKAKDAWKAVRDLVEKAEDTVHKDLTKAAPKVQRSLDASLDVAAKGFSSTLKTIDTRTEKEQKELLKAYKRFLSGQADFVDSKLKALEERTAKGKTSRA